MVGGGPDAFIGAVHRMAARLDGRFTLAAGAFSSDPSRSRTAGEGLGVPSDRRYEHYQEMADREAQRPDGIRVVSIVTPNHLHAPVAKAFLQRDIHVVCDKPMTTTVADAEDLCRLAATRGLLFAVTYNYSGYPMVKEARARVLGGALGEVRKVIVEYSQGWLRTLLEAEGHKQAEWRSDPERAGASSALGDIGSHAHHLVRYVTGLEVRRLFADLGTVVQGRRMEDDATVLLELDGGARGVLLASQVATGERNHLRLRVYGAEASLDWCQEEPNRLRLLAPDGTETILHRGGDLAEATVRGTRLPAGHPEGFIEAFANVYGAVADALEAGSVGSGAASGADLPPPELPDVRDGAQGVHFIHQALESDRAQRWIDAEYVPPR